MKRIAGLALTASLLLPASALAQHARSHHVDRFVRVRETRLVETFPAVAAVPHGFTSVNPSCAITYSALTMCDVQRVSLSFAEANAPNTETNPWGIGSCWLASGTGPGCNAQSGSRTGKTTVVLESPAGSNPAAICATWATGFPGEPYCFLERAV